MNLLKRSSYQTSRLLGEGIIKFELDSIDGTQIPTNIPACLSPLNHRYIENRNEIKAAAPQIIRAFA
jgi:hypothetical protein